MTTRQRLEHENRVRLLTARRRWQRLEPAEAPLCHYTGVGGELNGRPLWGQCLERASWSDGRLAFCQRHLELLRPEVAAA